MKTLFTDASFDYRHTDKTTENVVRGKICVSDGEGFHKVERVAIGKVPDLKQYINVFELIAIARAVELTALSGTHDGSLKIFSDSRVAVIWASSGKVRDSVRTDAHINALDYLKTAKKMFGGVVTFNHINRESNPAGHILEAELEKEKPYA